MLSTTKVRAASVLGAVAVAGALSLSAVPANAAGAEISLASTTFTIGDWGSGLAVTGSGFDLDADVTVSLVDVQSSGTIALDSIVTGSDDAGAILLDWTPSANAMTADYENGHLAVLATDGSGNLTAEVPLTLFAPEGIWTDAATITTAELADENVGAIVWAGGYTPGESVTTTVVYNGHTFTYVGTADRFGAIAFSWSLIGGTVEPGAIDITVLGADSKLSQSISVAVTGPTIELGGAPDGEVTPVQVSPAGGAVTSPRVAG